MSLVLARRVGQSIVIGDDIKITVTEIRSGVVKFSLDAPADVPIWRDEVAARMDKS